MTTGHGEPDPEAVCLRRPGAHRQRRLPRPPLSARLDQTSADAPAPGAAPAGRRPRARGRRSDAPSHDHHEPGEGNGNGAVPALPPPPYAIALTAGGKVLRFALRPAGRGFDPQRPAGRPARPGVQGRSGRRSRGDRWIRKRLSGHPSARVLIFPVTEANVVGGAARGVNAIRLDSKDRVIGFVLANKKREGLTVRTNRGPPRSCGPPSTRSPRAAARATPSSSAARSTPSSPPRPSRSRALEEVGEGGGARNDAEDSPDQKSPVTGNGGD